MTKIARPQIRKKSKHPARSPVSADIEMGKRIRDRRNECKMSQQELAAILGVSFQQVQKYEKGTNRITAQRLALIASTFKMRPEELYQTQDVLPDVSSLIDVTDKATLRLLQAYGGIKDQATRRQMVALIETIADAADASGQQAMTPIRARESIIQLSEFTYWICSNGRTTSHLSRE